MSLSQIQGLTCTILSCQLLTIIGNITVLVVWRSKKNKWKRHKVPEIRLIVFVFKTVPFLNFFTFYRLKTLVYLSWETKVTSNTIDQEELLTLRFLWVSRLKRDLVRKNLTPESTYTVLKLKTKTILTLPRKQ